MIKQGRLYNNCFQSKCSMPYMLSTKTLGNYHRKSCLPPWLANKEGRTFLSTYNLEFPVTFYTLRPGSGDLLFTFSCNVIGFLTRKIGLPCPLGWTLHPGSGYLSIHSAGIVIGPSLDSFWEHPYPLLKQLLYA